LMALQQQQQQQQADQQAPRTRSHGTSHAVKLEAPRRTSPRKALQPVHNAANAPMDLDHDRCQKKQLSSAQEAQPSFPPMPERKTFEFLRPSQMHISREPAASGIQRSNLTSAIQSQMISSTAGTGVKAGTSREVHQLKRQVLERTHTGSLSVGSIPSSHRMTDLAGVLKQARAPAPQRAAKSKAQEKLGGIQEEADPYAEDVAAEAAVQSSRRRKAVKRDPKPGYCENCRDKYEDFEEVSRLRVHALSGH
jgi:regulatory subunit for Cdc7p protein kinase